MLKQNNNNRKRRKAIWLITRVANNIKHIRKANGISQEMLKEETGLTISRYESGKHDMTLSTLGVLSRHLKVEPWELLKTEK